MLSTGYKKMPPPQDNDTCPDCLQPPENCDFRILVENSRDVLMLLGPERDVLYVSPSCERMLGWTQGEVLASGSFGLILPEDRELMVRVDEAQTDGMERGGLVRFRAMRKDGSHLWVEGATHHLDSTPGARGNVVLVLRDISERVMLETELRRRAMQDGLTGIANRRAFDEALGRDWDAAVRTGGQLGLLLIDVDWFKSFNDRLGHQAGDDCLRAIAQRLASMFERDNATVARYGGEEFAIILPGLDRPRVAARAHAACAAIRSMAIEHPGNPRGIVTVSVGAANLSPGTPDITSREDLVALADHMLYKAKLGGRDRAEIRISSISGTGTFG